MESRELAKALKDYQKFYDKAMKLNNDLYTIKPLSIKQFIIRFNAVSKLFKKVEESVYLLSKNKGSELCQYQNNL